MLKCSNFKAFSCRSQCCRAGNLKSTAELLLLDITLLYNIMCHVWKFRANGASVLYGLIQVGTSAVQTVELHEMHN